MLRLHDVSRRYGGLRAVDAITLDIAAGSRHAIIGPNGAGKSTLLNLIAGTTRPTTGKILLGGTDVTRLPAHRRARHGMARTFQHPAVIDTLSVVDNLALAASQRPWTPARRGGHTVAVEMELDRLRRAGLTASAATPAGALPYGQRHLLEIGVALTARPSLLLLDEPSAGLDTAAIAAVTALLGDLGDDVTVVLVDHHVDLVFAVADTVTVLSHGQHLITGTAKTVRSDSAVRAIYLAMPGDLRRIPRRSQPHDSGRVVLSVRSLHAGYSLGAVIISAVDLDIAAGEITAIVGRNGAGKTTLVNSIAGLHPLADSAPLAGTVHLGGRPVDHRNAHAVNQAGLATVPQGRRLFTGLTVAEHLAVASRSSFRRQHHGPWARTGARDRVLDMFPQLASRLSHTTGQLSGGEQQMLAIARALLAAPQAIILDEPVEGLAPLMVPAIADILADLADDGVAIAITDQNLSPIVTAFADRIHPLVNGRLHPSHDGTQIRSDPTTAEAVAGALAMRVTATEPDPTIRNGGVGAA